MSSLLVEPPGGLLTPVRGVQTPRIFCAPDGDDVQGRDVAEFLARNGLILDPWQRFVFEKGLAEKPDGDWSAFEVAVIVGRQNGKSLLLAAREIVGLFMFGEELIVHTAHQWKTAHKSFLLVQKIIRNAPDLLSKVKRFSASPGLDAVLLKDGRSIEFIARTKDSGVGWSVDCVIMDEAFDLKSEEISALLPTVLAMPNPQVWYATTAAKAHSEHLLSLRARGLKGDSEDFCYMEWSAPEGCDPTDPREWAKGMPALGSRITEQRLAQMQKAFPSDKWGREVLGWPDSTSGPSVFPVGAWDKCVQSDSSITSSVTFAIEVAEDRQWSCVAAAGTGPFGMHVESVDYRPGTDWVVPRAVALAAAHRKSRFVVQSEAAAGALITDLKKAGVIVVSASGSDYAHACGDFYDGVVNAEIRHLGQAELDMSAAGAQKKARGDAFVWDRRKSLDISPLAAVTLAFWGVNQAPPPGRFISF